MPFRTEDIHNSAIHYQLNSLNHFNQKLFHHILDVTTKGMLPALPEAGVLPTHIPFVDNMEQI